MSAQAPARDDLAKVARVRAARGAKDSVGGVRARYGAYPTSTDEVAEIMRAATRHRVPVVPRGAGSVKGSISPIRGLRHR